MNKNPILFKLAIRAAFGACLMALAALALIFLSGCATKPTLPMYRSDTAPAVTNISGKSNSMAPLLVHGDYVHLVRYVGQPLHVGQVIVYRSFDGRRIIHMIADISADGQSLYMTGINNRRSDGWIPLSRVIDIAVFGVTARK